MEAERGVRSERKGREKERKVSCSLLLSEVSSDRLISGSEERESERVALLGQSGSRQSKEKYGF